MKGKAVINKIKGLTLGRFCIVISYWKNGVRPQCGQDIENKSH